MGQKKKRVTKFHLLSIQEISSSLAMTFPCIGWNTGIYRLSIVFHPCFAYHPHSTFRFKKISSSLAMTFPCIGWNTDNEEDAVQYRLGLLDYFFHPPPPFPCVWKPTWVGLGNLGGDPHSSPNFKSGRFMFPPSLFSKGSRKRREKWKFYQLTR